MLPAARLPHGVRLPASLQADDALDLIKTLAEHYGCAHLLITPDEIEDHLTANRNPTSGRDRRRLDPGEWKRLYDTDAWRRVRIATYAVMTRQILAAVRQAALECAQCATPLTGPPTATWGHCPTCLVNADLDELRSRPCPATGADTPHHWGPDTCIRCGMPAPNTTTRPRRLNALPSAA